MFKMTFRSRLLIILALVTFALYANTLQNGYVMDDVMVLKDNTIVKKGIKAIPELLTSPHLDGYIHIPNDMYRPLSLVMFAAEYSVFGAHPLAGHLINIVVYIACVWLLFIFLHKLFEQKKIAVAFIAALLFAIHPIHTEVVANIKSRDELLCYLFSFLSLTLLINYMKTGKVMQFFSGIISLFLAYLSKETAITFLVVIPLVFFFFCNDNKRRALFITGGTLIVTIAFLAIRTMVLNKYNANEPNVDIDFTVNALANAPSAVSRLATEFLVLGKYLRLLIIPYPLLCNYSYNSIPFAGFGDIPVLCSIVIYAGIAFAGIIRLARKKKDPWAFGILFFLVTISLFTNFFFLIGNEMAERFLFFPSTGFCLLAALSIDRGIITKNDNIPFYKNKTMWLVLVPVSLIFSGITIARNNDWKSNYTLYKTDLERSPDDCRLHYYLANTLSNDVPAGETNTVNRSENDNEIMDHLQQALAIYPDFTEAHVALALVFTRLRMYDSAIAHNLRALALYPSNSIASYNLGTIYYKVGRYADAIELFKKTIALSPGYQLSYINLARCYADYKQYDSAIVYFHEMLALAPNSMYAYQGLANAFSQKRNIDSTQYYFERIVALDPSNAEMKNNLGAIYLSEQKLSLAIAQFQKAINIDPNYAVAYGNLGYAYFLAVQYREAIESFKKELSLTPKSNSDISYIATCYRKLNEPDSAKKYEAMITK